ncbi:hypothetical protein ON010_g11840 [Phytophthora cinnamomi]|nr:hypothetical protein ON010_g11840 [Phytophthora cinnamomi]
MSATPNTCLCDKPISVIRRVETEMAGAPCVTPVVSEDTDVVMDADTDSVLSSYVGSSAPTTTPLSASTPGAEIPYSLASMDADSDRSQEGLTSNEPATHGPDVANRQGSNDNVEYLKTVAPTRNPTQVAYLLSWFEGNCRLGIVKPLTESNKLYPEAAMPTTEAAALAVSCTHLLLECNRAVDARISSTYWAGPSELRAYAQNIRQPVLVLDEDENGNGRVQLYSYDDYDLPSVHEGETDQHETGCYRHVDDEEIPADMRTAARPASFSGGQSR